MATYRAVLDACILGSDTTNAAAVALQADPARIAAALVRMAAAGAIEPFDEGTTHQHRWRLVAGVEYHTALTIIEESGLVLDDPIA